MKIRLMKDENTEADYEGYAPVDIEGAPPPRVTFPEATGGDNTITGYVMGAAYCPFAWDSYIRITKGHTPHIVFDWEWPQ